MKKFLYLSLILAIMVFALGCTTRQFEAEIDVEVIESAEIKEVIFSEEYETILEKEDSYDIYTITGIEQFKNYLSEINSEYNSIESEDAKALVAFVEFRLNLLEAQKNILSAEEKIGDVVCENESTAEDVINQLESVATNTNSALVSLHNFRTNFSEFSAQTRINHETEETLYALIEETTTAREEFITAYEISCLQ